MGRKRRFQLAALVVLAVTVLLVGFVLSAPGLPRHDCPPRPPNEVCDPPGDGVSTPRTWVGVGGVVLAFVLFMAGTLEGAFPDRETQTGQ